jgi:leucyl-tRNA synthetase
VLAEILRSLILLLAPFAPFLSAELWQEVGGEGSILRTPWPKFDDALAKENEIEIPVQVNGKLRSLVRIAAEATPQEMEKLALADAKLQAFIAGKQVAKVIVVPGKMVNVVVR